MTSSMIRARALTCLVLFIAGCSGRDDLTDEQYFERLQEIGDGISEASESLFATVGPLLTTPGDAQP
jgi:hypothetical protein